MRMRKSIILFFPFLLFGCLGPGHFGGGPSSTPSVRDPNWARPMKLEGVPNLYKVAAGLYRSAQPTTEGMKNLQAMGIKTIVNLRSHHSDRDEVVGTDLACRRLSMQAWNMDTKKAHEFMRIVTDPNNLPVLVHCRYGADRTGAMCATYRVAVQGWGKDEAIREMTEGGFGFHEIFLNIPAWIEALDVNDVE